MANVVLNTIMARRKEAVASLKQAHSVTDWYHRVSQMAWMLDY